MLLNCFDFVLWPCGLEELRLRLHNLIRSTARQPSPLADAVNDECTEVFARLNLIGQSPAFTQCVQQLLKLARWSVPVLIQGETGTGKELAARALHYLGLRQDGPFVPLNCGALPSSLFANELFGHERGSFTDAKGPQKGLITQAEGGTLFLDEVDSLSLDNQIVLLRFLQDQCYRPLGSEKFLQSNVTVLSATNADLEQKVRAGEFRQDLFYRLNVARLTMPSLSQRPGDIALLAQHFLRQFSARYQQSAKTLASESLLWLERQTWPGNVRELENLIHREFLLTEGPVIRIDCTAYENERSTARATGASCYPAAFTGDYNQARAQVLADFEKRYLDWLMCETQGNISLAARLSGKERRNLGRLLQKHRISRQDYLPTGFSGRSDFQGGTGTDNSLTVAPPES